MLPSPFPKLLLWSPAGGVTPQAEKRWPVPRRGWRMARVALLRHKKRPVTTTGRFCIGRVGDRAGRVSSAVYHVVHLGQSGGAAAQGAGGGLRDALVPCSKDVQTRGARSGTDRAPLVWRSFIRRRGPACRSEEKVLEGRGKGRPGPCPLRRRKLRASRAAGGRTFSPKRCPSPSAFPLSLTLRPTAVPDRCRAGRIRDRRPGGRGRLRQRPCR